MSRDLGDGSESLEERLLAHRVVMLRGYLDAALATSVAGQLMALDAWGDERVRLHVGSAGGELDAALTVMDTIGALGVPVEAIGSGEVSGPAIGVLAVARPRFVTPHTIIRLGLDPVAAEGTAEELLRLAGWREELLLRFAGLVAEATGTPLTSVTNDLRSSRVLDPEQAQQYGLVDCVWEKNPHPGPS